MVIRYTYQAVRANCNTKLGLTSIDIQNSWYECELDDFRQFLKYLPLEVENIVLEMPHEIWIWQRRTHPKYAKTNNWQLAMRR